MKDVSGRNMRVQLYIVPFAMPDVFITTQKLMHKVGLVGGNAEFRYRHAHPT